VPGPLEPPKQHRLEVKLVSKGVGKLIGGKRQASY
jgi:hypothetical protein